MKPRIETIPEKKLIGKRLKMSLSKDKTSELWRSFMPQRKTILNASSEDLICMRVFEPSLDLKDFNPNTEFDKWAVQEVSDFYEVPDGMETYRLSGGLYAVFLYKGAASAFQSTSDYIYGVWLPNSEYELDKREHFEIMGEKYKNNHPDSEEDIWIPIKRKTV